MATVEVFPSSDGQFVDVECTDGRLIGRPVFYGKGRDQEPILMIVVKDRTGAIVNRYLVRISGSTLALRLEDRTHPVTPQFMKKLECEAAT